MVGKQDSISRIQDDCCDNPPSTKRFVLSKFRERLCVNRFFDVVLNEVIILFSGVSNVHTCH